MRRHLPPPCLKKEVFCLLHDERWNVFYCRNTRYWAMSVIAAPPQEIHMTMQKPNEINQLIGQFLELQEQWEDDAVRFNWDALKSLAAAGATAYNEGNGPSFQILAIDGMHHGEFHARFLDYSLEAGFDPFKLALAGSGRGVVPVLGHESLALSAQEHPWSAKMLAQLHDLARRRFDTEFAPSAHSKAELEQTLLHCRESIPPDVAEKLAAAAAALVAA